MQNSQLDRLLKLAKRTGDRLIVTSNDGAEPVVILPLTEYEGMLDSMTFFRSQPNDQKSEWGQKGGQNQEERAYEDIKKFAVETDSRIDPDEDFDPVALEKQVMAAMVQEEEPRVIPVEISAESETSPSFEEAPRKPITRKINQVNDGGEERFYLEAV